MIFWKIKEIINSLIVAKSNVKFDDIRETTSNYLMVNSNFQFNYFWYILNFIYNVKT